MSDATSRPKLPGVALILWGVVLIIVPMIAGLSVSAIMQAQAFEKIASSQSPNPTEPAGYMRHSLIATAIAIPISLCGLILLIVGIMRYFGRPVPESFR
jgi:ABC-type Fe3+ transport system permease subunit